MDSLLGVGHGSLQTMDSLLGVSYMDRVPKNLTAAILLFADEGGLLAVPKDHKIAEAWGVAGSAAPGTYWGDHSFVVRANTVEVVRRDLFQEGGGGLRLRVGLQHVGRSSWRTAADLLDAGSGAVLARVWTTNVFVARAGLRPEELPDRDGFRKMVGAGGAMPRSDHVCKAAAAAAGTTTPPAGAYTWRTHVRATDCDDLGHVNNTRYASMAEEALGFALHGGAFAEGSEASALARRPVVTMHIDYLEQLLPYTALRAAVWFDEARKVFVVRFETDCNGTPGAVASTVVLCTVRQNANREHVEQEQEEQARSSRL